MELRVGLYSNAPKIFRDEDGQAAGFFVQVLDEIATREGWQLLWSDCPWEQCLNQLEQGQLDLMVDVAYTPERDQRFDFNREAVLASWSVMYVRGGVDILSWVDLHNQRIAVLRGSIQYDFLRRYTAEFAIRPQFLEVNDFTSMFQMLDAGEADAGAVNRFFGARMEAQYAVHKTGILFLPGQLHFAVPEGRHTQTLQALDRQLRNLKETPHSAYYQAEQRWLAAYQEPSVDWAKIRHGIGITTLTVLLVLTVIFVLWNRRLRREVGERIRAETALRHSESQFRLLAENMHDLVCLRDSDGAYRYVSPSVRALLGFSPTDLQKQDLYTYIHPDDRERIQAEEHAKLLRGETTLTVYRMRTHSGNYCWLETLSRPIFDATGQLLQIQTASRDVTETVRMRQQLEHDALHDALTGLANRTLMQERLQLALSRLHRYPNLGFALLFIDLDHFKVINDSLGHAAGDCVLVGVARRLEKVIRETDLVARLGGDEFIVLLEHIDDPQEQVQTSVERVFAAFSEAFILEGSEVRVDISVGLILADQRYRHAAELLRDADIALYRAKAEGRARYALFNPAMHEAATHRLALENQLRLALQREEFVLYYQPIVCLRSGELRGFEALVRWQHPSRGLLAPDEFIPVLEEIHLITALGQWVLTSACRQLQRWLQMIGGNHPLTISVNVAAAQLLDSDFLQQIDHILQELDLAGHHLMLEITETTLVKDLPTAQSLLLALRGRGVGVSIDDFGSGYSSFHYLHTLPLNLLKIDKSFIDRLAVDQRQRRIVETIVILARQLGLKTVAEGVETDAQRKILQTLGCPLGQGYLFDKPLPADLAERRLWSQHTSISSWTGPTH